jgi:hypothetical protein
VGLGNDTEDMSRAAILGAGFAEEPTHRSAEGKLSCDAEGNSRCPVRSAALRVCPDLDRPAHCSLADPDHPALGFLPQLPGVGRPDPLTAGPGVLQMASGLAVFPRPPWRPSKGISVT